MSTRAPIATPSALCDMGKRSDVDGEFARFFEDLGYEVSFEGLAATGERWHEISDDDDFIQVSYGTPIALFLMDLPYFARGKLPPDRSEWPSLNYWCACDDNAVLRRMLTRVRKASDE